MSNTKSNTVSKHILEKEKVIIDAGRKRFAHYGFTKVTMEEIAADIEMGKASLYYYFPTKESLFYAVLAQEQNEFIKVMEGVLETKLSASDKLIEFVNKRLIYFQRFLNLGTLSFHTFLDTKSFYKKFFMDFEAKELGLINQIISEGQANGEFDKKLPKNIGTVFIHILHGLRIRTLRTLKELNQNDDTIKELQAEMDIAIKIFIKGFSN